ncbi:MAG TPA: HNH endonuclease signature motif containing protein, partial [Steroidobacteraceae bacterium]|nr:HNH endonuclease signature motif containing protein [Steroidobacteraceae bacterium]
VNHNRTHREELEGEFLWSPKKKPSSGAAESSSNMTKVMPGDVVFACSLGDSALRAVGVALSRAREATNPLEFGRVRRQAGSQRGWHVTVRFAELPQPLPLKQHVEELARVLPEKHSPLRASGDGNPGIYLAAIPRSCTDVLRRLIGDELDVLIDELWQRAGSRFPDDVAEEFILQRTDLSPAAKLDLIKARHGQGVYRDNLQAVETACRLTGLLDRRHLRAAHIKPWNRSSDAEKLDGCNGLLLSPHLEHLFSRGYLSFSDAGELLISRHLNPAVLDKWALQLPRYVEPFRPEQCRYLEYHRRAVFDRPSGGRRKSQDAYVDEPAGDEPMSPVTVYGVE